LHITEHTVTIDIDLAHIGELSSAIITATGEQGATVGETALAAAYTIGAILGPPTSPVNQVKFLQDIMDWVGMYFHEGQVN
jgi:hypothetical protein